MIQRCGIFFIAFVLSNSICFADDGFFGGSDFSSGSSFNFSSTFSSTSTDFGSLNYTQSNFDFSGSGIGAFGDFNYSPSTYDFTAAFDPSIYDFDGYGDAWLTLDASPITYSTNIFGVNLSSTPQDYLTLWENSIRTDTNSSINLFTGILPPDATTQAGASGWVDLNNQVNRLIDDMSASDFGIGQGNQISLPGDLGLVRGNGSPTIEFKVPELTEAQAKAALKDALTTPEGLSDFVSLNLGVFVFKLESKALTPEQSAEVATKLANFVDLALSKNTGDATTGQINAERLEEQKIALREFAQAGGVGVLRTPLVAPGSAVSGEQGIVALDNAGRPVNLKIIQQDSANIVVFEDSTGFHAVDLNDLLAEKDFFVAPTASQQSASSTETVIWHENVDGNQTLDQWRGVIGDANVQAAVTADPVGVADVVAGTSVWNGIVGVEAVNGVMRADPMGTLEVVRGTSIAVEYFGQEAVEAVIRQSPDVAVQAARALEFAEKAGYSEEEVKAFIAANPTDWYTYKP